MARLAGLPKAILDRSKAILKRLEERKEIVEKKLGGEQLLLFGNMTPKDEECQCKKETLKGKELTKEQKIVMRVLDEIEPDKLTPLEALLKLNELKKILSGS